jgi:hypothetical protein
MMYPMKITPLPIDRIVEAQLPHSSFEPCRSNYWFNVPHCGIHSLKPDVAIGPESAVMRHVIERLCEKKSQAHNNHLVPCHK